MLKQKSAADTWEDEDGRYTDADLFALLCRDGMGGFGGLTWDVYCHTPDHVIRDSYFAEFDDDHRLVTLRQRTRRLRNDRGVTGSVARAGQELPSREQLEIPEEAWRVNPMISHTPFGQGYLLMFWSVWRRRQAEGVQDENGEPISDAYILKRWMMKAGSGVQAHGKPSRFQSQSQN